MKKIGLLAAFVGFSLYFAEAQTRMVGNIHNTGAIKIALNFYSFNTPLLEDRETLESVIDYAAGIGYSGLDITGYYFKGYPAVPSDEYRSAGRASGMISLRPTLPPVKKRSNW